MNIGDKLPDFNLQDVSGKYYSSSDFSDAKVLAVIFSCNHCPYVHAYEDRVIDLQNRYKQEGVSVVAINSNDAAAYPEDSFEEMIRRAKMKGFNFPYLRDEDQTAARTFSAMFTPQLFVFDEKRKLAFIGKIDDNWREPEKVQVRYLEAAIKEILEGKEVSMPETYAVGCSIKWK